MNGRISDERLHAYVLKAWSKMKRGYKKSR